MSLTLKIVQISKKICRSFKSKRHRAFDAEVNDSDDDDFSFEFKKKKKVSDEIAALFKKTVNKMLKSE